MVEAPPTTPGEVARDDRPLSRPALWSLICGAVALFITPLGIAAIVLGTSALIRMRRHASRERGQGLAIAGVVCGAIGLVIMSTIYVMIGFGIYAAVDQARALKLQRGLEKVQQEALAYAKDTGVYPTHVAELAADPNRQFTLHYFVHRHLDHDAHDVAVGDFSFADYTGDESSKQALRDALASIDTSTPYYRFGDAWFVRRAAPLDGSDLIAAWSVDRRGHYLVVVFDDGSTTIDTPGAWEDLWKADARARLDAGMPALARPPLEPAPPER